MPTKKTKKKLAVKTNKVASLVGGGAAIKPSALERTKPLSGLSGGGSSGGGHGITTIAQTVASVTAIGSLATGIWASAKNDGGNKQG